MFFVFQATIPVLVVESRDTRWRIAGLSNFSRLDPLAVDLL
jgi:hypothetical protein